MAQFKLNKDPSIEELAMRYYSTNSPMTGMLIINQIDARFGVEARFKALTAARQTLEIVGLRALKGHHSNEIPRRKPTPNGPMSFHASPKRQVSKHLFKDGQIIRTKASS